MEHKQVCKKHVGAFKRGGENSHDPRDFTST